MTDSTEQSHDAHPFREITGPVWAPLHADVQIPTRAEDGAACMDIRAYFSDRTCLTGYRDGTDGEISIATAWENGLNHVIVPPMTRIMVPTGLRLVLPRDLYLLVRPRSGYIKHSLRMVNAPGTVDSSYRGEIYLLLENISVTTPARIDHGVRLAQCAFDTVLRPTCGEPEAPGANLDVIYGPTDRGTGGFGSTGNT